MFRNGAHYGILRTMETQIGPMWRFWRKVDKSAGEDSCWAWLAGQTTNGYGSCLNYLAPKGEGRTIHAHRLAWLIEHGSIGPEMQIDHVCRNRLCVNVRHLEQVTQYVNLSRRPSVGKAECKRGHAFTPENTHVLPGGQ